MLRTTRPFRFVVAVALTIGALAGVVAPVAAQDPEPLPENPYERLAEIKRRQAQAAVAVDLLSISHAEVQQRLEVVQGWIAAQEEVVAARQAELVEAELALAEARRKEEAKAAELAELEELMAEIAVEAYMHPPQLAAMNVIYTHDLSAAEKADVMLRAKAERDEAVADALDRAEKQLAKLRKGAEKVAEHAESLADEAAQALADLDRARDEQVALAEQIVAKLDQQASSIELLGEAETLAFDAVRKQTAAMLARARGATTVDIVDVRGIKIHANLAPALDALLELAHADGVPLDGWGYRSTDQQISLRLQHCSHAASSPHEAIYVVPASSCSPPTAKPGSSKHELGLAIDFHLAGQSISTRQSPGFQWLAEHAADFGLFNLPSEPWHWSVDGN